MEYIDYNELLLNVHKAETDRHPMNTNYPTKHYLLDIAAAIGRASENKGCDYGKFEKEMSAFTSFRKSYENNILGSAEDALALAAIKIFCFMGMRGMKIHDMDNFVLNQAPRCFSDNKLYPTLNTFLYELIAALTYRSQDDIDTLDCIKLYEEKPTDEELQDIMAEKFDDYTEDFGDVEIRTSHGYENYMLGKNLDAILCSIASWFADKGKSFEWHIKARLYYNGE